MIVKAVSYPAPHQWGAAVRLLGCNVRTGRWGGVWVTKKRAQRSTVVRYRPLPRRRLMWPPLFLRGQQRSATTSIWALPRQPWKVEDGARIGRRQNRPYRQPKRRLCRQGFTFKSALLSIQRTCFFSDAVAVPNRSLFPHSLMNAGVLDAGEPFFRPPNKSD